MMLKNSIRQPEAANLNSEKTKDIRMTNIIAARGKSLYQISLLFDHLTTF